MVANSSDTPPSRPRKVVKVAVIGSGLAGLTSAYLLSTPQDRRGEEEDDEEERREDVTYDVHLFEKADRIGMDAASIEVQGEDGNNYRIDSPMRAVQGGYYDHLLQLYRRLGIQLRRSNFTYAFLTMVPVRGGGESAPHPPSPQPESATRQDGTTKSSLPPARLHKRTTFIYNGSNGLSLRPASVPVNNAEAYTPSARSSSGAIAQTFRYFYQTLSFALAYLYLLCISSYHHYSSHLEPSSTHWVTSSTFKSFLAHYRIPDGFTRAILVPLFSCVATCSVDELLEYPAAEFLEYIVKTFGTDHYVVKNGVRDVVNALLQNVPRETNLHLDCELVGMKKALLEDGLIELEDSQGKVYHFDHVIFATQANQARYLLRTYYKSLLDAPERDEAAVALEKQRLDALAAFTYTHSVVVNHYDGATVMSDAEQNRRILNLASLSSDDEGHPSRSNRADEHMDDTKMVSPADQYVMATHDLSLHNSLLRRDGDAILQTTNPTVSIDDDKVISKSTFERAIVTLQSKKTLKDFLACGPLDNAKFQGKGNVWFAGAWAAEGIPLLEGCVTSSERVVEAIKGS